jgi:hypothetical protein
MRLRGKKTPSYNMLFLQICMASVQPGFYLYNLVNTMDMVLSSFYSLGQSCMLLL